LQGKYIELISNIRNKTYWEKTNNSNLSNGQLKNQITQNERLIDQKQKKADDLNRKFKMDEKMDDADYSLKQSTLNISVLDTQNQKKQKQFERISKFDQLIVNLLIRIDQWELKYIIRSPIAGRVNLYSIWKVNQWVNARENIMLIVPLVQSIIVKGTLPVQNSGKIHVGQTVMISLLSHPHNEFGYIEGKISFIASAPMDSVYSFDVTLVNGLITTNRKVIPTQPQMFATGEIFIDNETLLKRIFEKFIRN